MHQFQLNEQQTHNQLVEHYYIDPSQCFGNNIDLQRLDNNQIPYPQSYTDQSAYQNQISYSPLSYIPYPPTYTDPHTDMDSKLFDNNQLQQPALSFQFINYPSTETYLSNEQQGHTTPQSEYSHTSNACHSCRKAYIRCKKENKDSTSCQRCIRAEELCIFDKNPGKRGRKPGIGNKPKENKTENRDINSADNTVKVIKQCRHGNNEIVASILTSAFNDGNGDDLQGGNCLQQLANGYALPTSTYNHQTNDQQRSNWGDEYVAELMQTLGTNQTNNKKLWFNELDSTDPLASSIISLILSKAQFTMEEWEPMKNTVDILYHAKDFEIMISKNNIDEIY
nr:1767_t:CDS:2 [Entrophospora candida]